METIRVLRTEEQVLKQVQEEFQTTVAFQWLYKFKIALS